MSSGSPAGSQLQNTVESSKVVLCPQNATIPWIVRTEAINANEPDRVNATYDTLSRPSLVRSNLSVGKVLHVYHRAV